MNSLLNRAAALAELISANPTGDSVCPLIEAVVACSGELNAVGESSAALELLETVPTDGITVELSLRVAIARARTLRAIGEYEGSLAATRYTLDAYADCLKTIPDDRLFLRICEAGCLWQLNRVEDAIRELVSIRTELLTRADSRLLGLCAFELSSAELFRGDSQAARRFALEALVSARRCDDSFTEAKALDNISRLDKASCRWPAAIEASREALSIYEAEPNRLFANIARRTLGIINWKCGELKEAEKFAAACLSEARSLGHPVHKQYASMLSGLIALHRGAFQEAEQLFGTRVELRSLGERSRPYLLACEYAGDIYLEQGDVGRAQQEYEHIWPIIVALVPRGDIAAEVRRRIAEVKLFLRDHERARTEALAALTHCRELGDRYEEAATYRILALSSAAVGKVAEAKKWFEQGFAYYDDIETPYEWGKLWMAYGDWLRGPNSGEYKSGSGAREAYLASRSHFEHMGALGKLKEVQARLIEMGDEGSSSSNPVAQSSEGSVEFRRPPRRPRGSAELDRRSQWARDTFAFVTRNKPVLDLLDEVAKLAMSGSPILVLGESGTGKELIAQAVHRLSGRSGNFMPINCGALPRDVIESELFGHVSGAFTGAVRDKAGLFEVCDHGTAFLDEIAEMSPELQSRLLRFLETGEFRRVGANRNIAVDTLVVAATNREKSALERGEGFRTDLYYRLAHAVVVLPPLRRRGEDIDILISHFLKEASTKHGKQAVLSAEARNQLIAYSWPGNVRQLRAAINRLVVLAGEEPIGIDAIQLDEGEAPGSLTEELELAERRRIVEALARARGVRTDAATILGMSRTTLIGKMKRFGIR